MKRALAVAILFVVVGCSRPTAAPLTPLPRVNEATMSVLSPAGPSSCVWKRVEPGSETILCHIDRRCDDVKVVLRQDGSDAFATAAGADPSPWICPAMRAGAAPLSFPSGVRNAVVQFDFEGGVFLTWQESRLPSLRDRIVARLRHGPPPIASPNIGFARLTDGGWQTYGATSSGIAASVEDLSALHAASMSVTPPDPRLGRLVSEAVPAAHPSVAWLSLRTAPGLAFVQGDANGLIGPLVFVLHGDDARIAPESPGESDAVDEQVRGSLVLLQVAGRLGPTYPRLWDASTGELLWSDPKAERAVFWPKP